MARTNATTYRRNRERLLVPGARCWICGRPIDLTITDPYDDGYGTADHVVPAAKGGSDALSNLRPAHFGCNRKRQDKDRNALRVNKTSREW